MKQVLIQLPDELGDRLQALADREHQSPEATVQNILRRRLSLDRFHELCQESQALAEHSPYKDEDDLLQDVS